VATDKMNDNSMVSLRRSGRGHIDELRLRNNAEGREVIRCEYGCTAYVWASSRGKRACPRQVLKKARHWVGRSTEGLRPKLWLSANSCLDLNFAPTRFFCVLEALHLEASPASLDAPHNPSHPIPSDWHGFFLHMDTGGSVIIQG
jgi:hypothetical protein